MPLPSLKNGVTIEIVLLTPRPPCGEFTSDLQRKLRDFGERRGIFPQHALRALVELVRRPAALGARARLDVGAEPAPARHAAPAELASQSVVTFQRRMHVARLLH